MCVCDYRIDILTVYLDASALHAELLLEEHLHLHTIVNDIYYANADMSVGMNDWQTKAWKITSRCFPSAWCLLLLQRDFGLACKQMWLLIK